MNERVYTVSAIVKYVKGMLDQNPYLSIFETLPAFQVMSVFGSERRNIDCDKPKFPDFYGVLNTKA